MAVNSVRYKCGPRVVFRQRSDGVTQTWKRLGHIWNEAVGLEDHLQIARSKDNFYTMSRPPTKGQYPQPDEDDPMYTSPADIKKTQAISCPNRGLSLKNPSSNQGVRGGRGGNRKSSVPDLAPVTPQHAQSAPPGGVLDYVLIPNANTLSKLDTLTRMSQAPRFPSPTSSPEEEEDVIELYASPRDIGSPMKKKDYDHLPIQSPRQSPPPIPAREKLYDHLTPRSRRKLIEQQKKGIDIADANRLANGGMYSLADTNGMPEGIYCLAGEEQPVVSGTNQSIGVYSIATEILPQSNEPIGIYDLAQDTILHSHANNTSRGGNHRQVRGNSRGSSATSPTTEMYSYATVRSNTPDDNLYAEARNPQEWYRSPSPPRAMSPLAIHSSPSPPRTQKPIKPPKPVKPDQSKRNGHRQSPPSAKLSVVPHVQPTDDPELLYATPNKPTPSSPQVVHIQHVVPNEENPDNIYAIPHSGSFKGKSVSSREATPNYDFDEDDEEAPPLPERNYNWSDIEDEDDDILHSDDEDDHDHYPGFHPIGVYATVTEPKGQAKPAQLSPPISGVRCSVEVGEMETVYMNLTQLRKQLVKAAPEESIYDTLEKVVAATNSPTTTTLPSISMNVTPTLPPLSKKALKLMQKMEKKAAREAERRKKQDARRKKKQEEEMKKMEKALKKGKKYKAKIQPKRYFESSLSSIVDSDGIPALVKSCAAIIERDGLESEGVYRVSGKKEDIMAIQEKYDQDPSIDLENLNMCINAVSGVMKAFFKLLPDPLIPESLLPALLDIPGQSLEAQKEKMHNQLSKLPHENLKTLSFLANHLYKVQLHQETNKMSASNLSIVFWPTLMRPPLKDLADPGKQLGFQLTMAKIIENPDFVPDIN